MFCILGTLTAGGERERERESICVCPHRLTCIVTEVFSLKFCILGTPPRRGGGVKETGWGGRLQTVSWRRRLHGDSYTISRAPNV